MTWSQLSARADRAAERLDRLAWKLAWNSDRRMEHAATWVIVLAVVYFLVNILVAWFSGSFFQAVTP
jgi:Co/Zn/Cd efflux system component